VEIIAHRGSSSIAPENTLAAAELAWQEQADAVEGDFFLSRDRQIVCIHDDTLKRTGGADQAVSELSLDELRKFDVGSWKAPQFAGQRIATLAEMLATVPPEKRFYVEVKCGPEIVPELVRVVSACGLAPEQIAPICLDLSVIAAIKRAIPQCPAYWVVEFKRNSAGAWRPTLEEMLRSATDAKLDGLDLMATGPIDAQLVRQAQAAGLRLCVWTVDDPILARQLLDLGVEGITTNRPGWLRGQLAR
jgi:glycerophosphoryl diester phosphodiesterase